MCARAASLVRHGLVIVLALALAACASSAPSTSYDLAGAVKKTEEAVNQADTAAEAARSYAGANDRHAQRRAAERILEAQWWLREARKAHAGIRRAHERAVAELAPAGQTTGAGEGGDNKSAATAAAAERVAQTEAALATAERNVDQVKRTVDSLKELGFAWSAGEPIK